MNLILKTIANKNNIDKLNILLKEQINNQTNIIRKNDEQNSLILFNKQNIIKLESELGEKSQ